MPNASLNIRSRLLRRFFHHFGGEDYITYSVFDPLMTFGHISLEEARALMSVVSDLGPGPIIEIGTLFGFSTTIIAMAKPDQRPLITVDNYSWCPAPLKPHQHRYLTRKSVGGIPGIHLVDQDKDEFWATYRGDAPAMVFIDADHSYEGTLSDIVAAQKVGARLVCGHDYGVQHPGVVKAVDESGGLRSLTETFWVLSDLKGTDAAPTT